jgi:hypothetical protein
MSFWRRGSKEKSPSPSGSDTIKRSKNIFNLMTSGRKSTRDIGIECKLDLEEQQMEQLRKSSMQSLLPERKHRHKHGSNQQLTSIIKSPERRYPYKSSTPMPAPIRVEIGFRNSSKYTSESDVRQKPIGIASPLPQTRTRSVLKNGAIKSYDNKAPRPKAQEPSEFTRQGSDRMSFRDYRDRLKLKNENKRITDNSDDELRQSYQQSFFVPM